MAEIYNPQVQEIGLAGLGIGGQFNPIQGYNPTQQVLQAGQQQVENYSRNLESLVGFSKTLADYSEQRAKKWKEDEYNLGIADILNGDAELSPDIVDRHRNDAQILQAAAEADGRVANTFAANGQLDVSQQFKEKSAAISGWRAYGQAVQLTKNAANESSGFFQGFIQRKDAIVPIPNGDGTFTMMAPNQLSSPEQIKAGLAIAQQEFIQKQGIGRINPVILAEHFAPTIQAVKSQVQANQLSEAARKAKETSIDTINGNLRSDFSNPDLTVENMSDAFQSSVAAYEIDGDMSKGVASNTAIKEALDTISTLPPDVAQDMLTKLSQVRKIAKDPNSLSLGSAYPSEFAETLDKINGKVEAAEAKAERLLNKQAEQAWTLLKKAEQDATMAPEELQSRRKQIIGILGQLVDQGSPDALKYRTELLADPPNIDYTLYRQYRAGVEQGKRPTTEQIDKDVASGRLSPEMGRELKVYATGSQRTGFMKQWGSGIESRVKEGLQEREVVSFNVFNKPSKLGGHVDQITNDLAEAAYTWYTNLSAQGKPPTTADLNQFIDSQLPRVIGSYFRYDNATKQFIPKPLSKNPELAPHRIKSTLSGGAREASGFNPRTIQLRSYNSGSNKLMSKAEVEENIRLFTLNQPLTLRAQQLANSNGGPVRLLTQQAQHNAIDPSPILSSPEAQRLSQYSTVAPWATQRYLASGGNYRQQMLQLQRIVEAQARSTSKKDSSEAFATLNIQGIDTQKAFNALVGKESGGNHRALNTAGSGATGLGQVMPENIGPWTREVLGRAMSQEEFRNNKAAQIRVVSTKFNQAIKSQLDAGHSPKEAIRRAAAIWYSGSAKNVNSTKPQYWNGVAYPSVKQYADDILARYARQV